MFAIHLRAAVEAAPRVKLSELTALLWKAFAEGQVTEVEAEELSGLIDARRAVQTAARPTQRHIGSRPRTSESMARRRTWAARSLCPPQIAAHFTLGEQAALAVVAAEVRRRGACSWSVGQLAAVGGISESTVKRALREARRLGLVSVEERRLTAWRSDTNVVRVIAPQWVAWLRLDPVQGRGVQTGNPTKYQTKRPFMRTATGQGVSGWAHGGRGSAKGPLNSDFAGAGALRTLAGKDGGFRSKKGSVAG
ncbi:hypothetical protein MPOCJGCO_4153 [Methylobacterium trifolii]|uniref:Helix-turn-helix domain-containing protein n=1 Tax=Methylobacterium trifolii TaxID=1003092 RepID=A0ABQ4U796_9HYPH|nr:hypothetical protein MPOCJGCO_4153 [Methylobacterium trifolii]